MWKTQSCLTLCNPTDWSLPGSSFRGILLARILEWVAISLSRGSSRPRDQACVSCISRRILYHWATREAKSPYNCLNLPVLLSCLFLQGDYSYTLISAEDFNLNSSVACCWKVLVWCSVYVLFPIPFLRWFTQDFLAENSHIWRSCLSPSVHSE